MTGLDARGSAFGVLATHLLFLKGPARRALVVWLAGH